MGKVIIGNFETRLDLPPNRILIGALKAKVDPMIVIGRTPDGEFYMAGTTADAGKILILLRRAGKLIDGWIE